eukprot:8128878-Heterocapsa_arctica.AAC.1
MSSGSKESGEFLQRFKARRPLGAGPSGRPRAITVIFLSKRRSFVSQDMGQNGTTDHNKT